MNMNLTMKTKKLGNSNSSLIEKVTSKNRSKSRLEAGYI